MCFFPNTFKDSVQAGMTAMHKNDKVCSVNSLYFSVKLEDGMNPTHASFHLR